MLKRSPVSLALMFLLMVASVFLPLANFVQVAKAATPVYNSSGSTFKECVYPVTTCTTSSVTPATSSDKYIIAIGDDYVSPCGTGNTPTNGQSYTTTLAVTYATSDGGGGNSCYAVAFYLFTVTSTTAFTVTQTTTTSARIDISLFDVSNLDSNVLDHQLGTCTSGCSSLLVTNAPTSYTSATVLVKEGQFGTTGYTVVPAGDPNCNTAQTWNQQLDGSGGAALCIPTASGSTTYDQGATSGIGIQVVQGAEFGPAAVVSATVIGPCTFFELQCWWYPLLFMFLYSGFVLLVAQTLDTTPRGKSHLFLSALTMGSLIAVIFGIMNIMFPLIMLLVNTAVVLKSR